MVKEIKKDKNCLFLCEACGFAYEEQTWAEKCQQWCEEHQACNLEITGHAVPSEE